MKPILFALSSLIPAFAAGLTPYALETEARSAAEGIDVPRPRLSWKLRSGAGGDKQTAYQLMAASSAEKLAAGQADLCDSGRVTSDETAWIAYGGTPLRSFQRVWWKTRVWDAAGNASAWSDAAQFTMAVPIERHYEAYSARVSIIPPVIGLVLHDLTTIRRSEQMRADFVANASHELRTPLAAVSGFIDTLRGHARDDEQARDKFLDIMSAQASRMSRLIEDLLSLTRIELNEHVPPQGKVEVEGLVREAAAALEPLARAERIAISIASKNKPVPVVG